MLIVSFRPLLGFLILRRCIFTLKAYAHQCMPVLPVSLPWASCPKSILLSAPGMGWDDHTEEAATTKQAVPHALSGPSRPSK